MQKSVGVCYMQKAKDQMLIILLHSQACCIIYGVLHQYPRERNLYLGECSHFLHWTNIVMHMVLYSKEVWTMSSSCCKLSMHNTIG